MTPKTTDFGASAARPAALAREQRRARVGRREGGVRPSGDALLGGGGRRRLGGAGVGRAGGRGRVGGAGVGARRGGGARGRRRRRCGAPRGAGRPRKTAATNATVTAAKTSADHFCIGAAWR